MVDSKIGGIGTDIVAISRIEELVEKFGIEKFADKILSDAEKLALEGRENKLAYLAKRFAGKEAVSKALGTGIGKIAFKDIEILNDEQGAPYVNLPDSYINGQQVHISLSDEKDYALAFVVLD